MIEFVNKPVYLDKKTHVYSWEGKDELKPCLSVTQLITGNFFPPSNMTEAMRRGQEIHEELAKEVNPVSPEMPLVDKYLKLTGFTYHDEGEWTRELISEMPLVADFGDFYLCGTPDLILEGGSQAELVEWKTGKTRTNKHILQAQIYMFLYRKGCADLDMKGAVVYVDHEKSIPVDYDHSIIGEIFDLYKAMTEEPLTLEIPEIQEYLMLKEEVRVLSIKERELKEKIVNKLPKGHCKFVASGAEISLTKMRRETFDKDLIRERVPEAIQVNETTTVRIKGGKCYE